MKLQSYLVGSILCGMTALAPSAAQAANCRLNNLVSFPLQGGSNAVPIKQNAAIGTLIRPVQAAGRGELMATCNGSTLISSRFIGLVPSAMVAGVYKTSLEGVGVKLEWEPTGGGRQAFPFDVTVDQPTSYSLSNAGTLYVGFYRIEGDFTGGLLGGSGPLEIAETMADALRVRRIMFDNIPFRLATCAITAGSLNQTVDLKTVSARSFGSDGGSPWKAFDLVSDNCDLSQFSGATFTFTGNTVPGMPELFDVSGGGRGVGIQLGVVGGGEIVPGTDVTLPVVSDTQKYAFQARYKRTGDRWMNGTARADVVVHVDYD